MRRYYQPLLFVMLTCYCLLAGGYTLPLLGNPSELTLPRYKEKELGSQLMLKIQQALPLVRDPVVTEYFNDLGEHISSYANANDQNFHFFVIRSSVINAFAIPGGYIGFHTGLILATQQESQLAAVMAHEISHVTERHIARGMANAKRTKMMTLGAMVASILVAMKNPQAGQGALMASQEVGLANLLRYSRQFEREADAIGMKLLYASGFNPFAMGRFFERMQKLTMSYANQLGSFLRTHPVTEFRIADADSRANQFDKKPYPSALRYYLVRARLRVNHYRTPRQAVQYFSHHLQTVDSQEQPAMRYGLALAYMHNKQYDKAIRIMQQLIKQAPNQTIYQMGLAEVYYFKKDYDTTLKLLHHSLDLHPENYPLRYHYAFTLLHVGKNHAASKLLTTLVDEKPGDIHLLSALQLAQGRSKQLVDAYETRAKIYSLYKKHEAAIIQLEQALKVASIPEFKKEIIHARIKELKTKKKAKRKLPFKV